MDWLPSLWIDLSKARKGQRVGGKYVHRWWNFSQGKWNYKYADKPHDTNHGVARTATSEHSIKVHSKAKDAATEKEAFDRSREQEMKKEHREVVRDSGGKHLFTVHIKPGLDRPIHIMPPGAKTARQAEKRMESLRRFENWWRRKMSVQTVYDAHGNPWFDVRLRGQSGEYIREGDTLEPSDRLSVWYYPDSPYNPFPKEDSAWVPSPFKVGNATEWIKEQHRQQRASGQRVKPAKEFPQDPKRPVTSMLERGTIIWRREFIRHKGKRGGRWVRRASNIGSGKRKQQFYARVLQEHFGLIVNSAVRQLVVNGISDDKGRPDPQAMARLLGYYGGPGRRMKIQIEQDSPSYRAVERAVNSYDPEKGWRFNTYLGDCLWWEQFKETKKILDHIEDSRKLVTTVGGSEQTADVFETLTHEQVEPTHQEVIESGAHYESAEEHMIKDQEITQDWVTRQEDRLARFITKEDDPDRQMAAFEAMQHLGDIQNLQQARAFVVHFQSEGGDEFIEPIVPEPEEKPEPSKKEQRGWVSMIKKHPSLTPAERAALLAVAPTGDLINLKPFEEVAPQLHKKHSGEFPRKPTVGEIVALFVSASGKLAGTPEFEAMQRKLSSLAKALQVLQSDAVSVLRKAKKGSRAKKYKYWRREGTPGNYKYFYRESGTKNIVHVTNAPPGHPHHDKKMGNPQLHSSEPNPEEHPQFFDPRSGRKMNRSIPEHAEWNEQYDPSGALSMWAARWRADPNNEESHLEHAYYDSDVRERDELKFNIDNRHFDEQLPKVRQFYKGMMDSHQAPDRALGLMVALLDQAYMRPGRKQHEKKKGNVGLVTLKVSNLKIKGNTATFSYSGKRGVQQKQTVTLDDHSMDILKELAEAPGKTGDDYLFSVPVKVGRDRVVFREIGYNKLIRNLRSLGVTPKQFRTYHGTEIFSRNFERLAKKVKGRITPKVLESVTEEAALVVAKALGHYVGKGKERKLHSQTALGSYIDPVVVRSLWLNALSPDINKAFKLQGRMEYQGLPISIENRKGSVRKWYDPHNKEEGKTKMLWPYGYIRRTKGVDGDHVDVYVGPNKDAKVAFVIHQMKAPDFKQFDEDKVMLGFDSADEAKSAYLKQYNNPKFFGSMTPIPMEQFKTKVMATKNHPMMLKSYVWFAHEDMSKAAPKLKFGRYKPMDRGSLYHTLKSGHYSIISAGKNPSHPEEKHLEDSHPHFEKRHEALRRDLEHHGLDHTEVEGMYGGKERSFIVHHHPDKKPQTGKAFMVHHQDTSEHQTIRDLGKKYNQESVIHSKGGQHEMHYVTGEHAGTHHKGEGHEIKPHASDFYTKVEHEDHPPTKFSLNFNWDTHHPHDQAMLKAAQLMGDLMKAAQEMVPEPPEEETSGESLEVGEPHELDLSKLQEPEAPPQEPEPQQQQPPQEQPKEQILGRDLHDEPEEGDEDDIPVHHVVADPPDKNPSEEAFSLWLHSHPIHESEHEYQQARSMGIGLGEMHDPETNYEEADDEDTDTAAGGGPEGIELLRPGEQEPGGAAIPQQPNDQQAATSEAVQR